MKCALSILISVLVTTLGHGAPFAVPAHVPPPFRRASLPMDPDAMFNLSVRLSNLAASQTTASPEHRRATAQCLALAIALDPENSGARSILKRIAGGESLDSPDQAEIYRAKAEIWSMFKWLASSEAGSDGNLLADLLGDSASTLDPKHPTAVSLRRSPEQGKWDGWVAPLDSFREKKPEIAPPLADYRQLEFTQPEEQNVPRKAPDFLASTASVGTVFFKYDDASGRHLPKHSIVTMQARPFGEQDEEQTGLHIDIPVSVKWEKQVRKTISDPVLGALETLHGRGLPEGKILILPGNYSLSRNGSDLSGPGFVLANCAVTGIATDATIIARVDQKGRIVLPEHFWSKLAALADREGGRLVVPVAAEEYFTALLAMEKPDFLLQYEVLMASSPEELVSFCAKVPDEKYASAFEKFMTIKEKSGTGPLGSYLANHFVRQRLVELAKTAPYHLSAKLLALQGAGKRPFNVERKILAASILEAISEIQQSLNFDIYAVELSSVDPMEKTYHAIREQLESLERYATIRDRDLVSKAKSVAQGLRTLYRSIDGRGEMWEKYDEIAAARKALIVADRALRLELSKITGDPLLEGRRALK